MKFFTLDIYHKGYLGTGEDPLVTAGRRYAQHREQMKGILPAEVLALAELPGVDDGLVIEVVHDREQRVLTLTMRCGDLQIGYYDLVLTYEDASITADHEWNLAQIARTTETDRVHRSDVAYHEVDRTEDGQVEHRILFHPGIWFATRCRALRWEQIPRPNRKLPRRKDRFPGGPTSPPTE